MGSVRRSIREIGELDLEGGWEYLGLRGSNLVISALSVNNCISFTKFNLFWEEMVVRGI